MTRARTPRPAQPEPRPPRGYVALTEIVRRIDFTAGEVRGLSREGLVGRRRIGRRQFYRWVDALRCATVFQRGLLG